VGDIKGGKGERRKHFGLVEGENTYIGAETRSEKGKGD